MNKEIIKKEKNETSENQKTKIILGSPYMPQEFDGKMRLAEVLHKSGLCPKGMNSIEKVFVALQYGHELGLSPMIAVQNIPVVNGRPSLMTTVMMGIIRASGKVIDLKEEEILDGNKIIGFEVTGKRKDTGNTVYKGKFTLEDAEKAGLVGKDGEVIKDNWKYPAGMLLYRAQSRFAKDSCPELFAGLLTKEEAENLEPIDITPSSENESLLQNIKENMDKENDSDIKIQKFEKEDEIIIPEKMIDVTGTELDRDGNKKYPEKNEMSKITIKGYEKMQERANDEKFNGKIHTVDELFPDKKEELKKSNFNSYIAWREIFDNDRAKNLKDSMNKKDKKYFFDLACSGPENYQEKNYKEDIKTIELYEKRTYEKGRK